MADPVQIFDLADLVGAPLIAVVEADAKAARRLAQFIREFGFAEPKDKDPKKAGLDDDLGDLRVLSFRYERPGTSEKLVVTVPLLSLLPLPALQVKHAEFDFHIRILEATGSMQEDTGKSLDVPRRGFKAMLSPTPTGSGEGTSTAQLAANMHVKVRMEQADLPAGLSRMLNVMAQTVATKSEPGKT